MLRSGGGNPKGGQFERDVSRRLSLWLSDGIRDDLLWRSALSGGRATIQLRAGKVNLTQSGDLTAISQGAYDFCARTFVECKHRKNLGIDRGLVCRTGDLYNFWRWAEDEAAKYGKRPLLIARQNYYPTLAVAHVGAGIFSGEPMIELRRWPASVYLFDEVTLVRPRLVRRMG